MRHHLLAAAGFVALAVAAATPGHAAICQQTAEGRLVPNAPITNCERAFGYYDEAYRWHGNRIDPTLATGYYDPDGHWVRGAPNGYYNRNHEWVAFSGPSSASGYRDSGGRWVPIGVAGYYAGDGRLVPVTRPGHYEDGHWVSTPTSGHYSSKGVWMPETAPQQETVWVPDTEPGYYDRAGVWHTGQVTGYYDAEGNWVTLGTATGALAYEDARPRDVDSREVWIESRIQHGIDRGEISRGEADRARDELASIRRTEDGMRQPDGSLSATDEALLQQRLDHLSVMVHVARVG